MNILAINLTRVTQHPQVRLADGRLDSIQIVPRGRATLREGMTIDPRWLSKNPQVLRVEQIGGKKQVIVAVPAVLPVPAPIVPAVTETKGEA